MSEPVQHVPGSAYVANPATDSFDLDVRTCFQMSDSGFESGTLAAYGKRLELFDSNNDTNHEFRGIDGQLYASDEKLIERALERGGIECHLAYLVFNDLVRKGILPKGDYFVRVSW